MTYDELYEIMKNNQTTPKGLAALSLPCPILADMIDDTTDIIPPSPKQMEMIREAACMCCVSTPQDFHWSKQYHVSSTSWNRSTVYENVSFINILISKKDETSCFIFYVYKERS